MVTVEALTNLDSIFKSRDITLPTKVRLVKAMVFPVVMYECEGWTIRNAEELMFLYCGLRRLLRVLRTARRKTQSILKEISPEYSNTTVQKHQFSLSLLYGSTLTTIHD